MSEYTNWPNGATSFGILLAGSGVPTSFGKYWFVDGDNGIDGNSGKNMNEAKKTIQAAVTAASTHDVILVKAKNIAAGASDPSSYAETIIIPAGKSGLSIVGLGTGRTQGGLPELKIGSGSTAMLTVRSQGCSIYNFGINGASSTGGGILLDGDASTKDAFGLTIGNCHFKNCKGSAAAATGGAIMWASTGSSWQVKIENCLFYNNRAGIVLLGTSSSRPQDIVIDNCEFHSSANTTVDADLYLSGGSGIASLIIENSTFGTVDVPAYASSPDAARYMDLTGCYGFVSNCNFACTGKTFGAAGNAAKIPATVRMANCYQEDAIITRT